MKIAAKKYEIKIESLPTSENAAQKHSYRVYLQVMDLETSGRHPHWSFRVGLRPP